MEILGASLTLLQMALGFAWIYLIYLTARRFLSFRRRGYLQIAHILRAVLLGEVSIFAEILRRVLIGMGNEGYLPYSVSETARSPWGMLPVLALILITCVDAILVFLKGRFENLAEEHEARLQIGRLASRLHSVSESLQQRNRELERANEALAAAERKFRDFFEHAPLHYHTLDRSGFILDSNELELRDLGYAREELVGQHVSKLMHPLAMELDQAALRNFWKTGVHAGTEVVLARKDGTPVPVRLYSTAVRDENGAIVAARTIWIDIAAQKQAEAEVARRAEELGFKNQELEARNRELSEVGNVISHDLKAPLRGIEAFAGFLEEDCGETLGATGRSHLASIKESCQRLRRMVGDLIEYARFGHTGRREPVALASVIQEVIDGLRLNVQARRAQILVVGEFPKILGDRTQLTVLFRNLIDNALKYARQDRIRVLIGTQKSSRANRVTVYVRDNGIGILKENQEKIFGLFQRLHVATPYEGSGVGLALVKKAVDFHGGQIWIESEPGKGSTFFISLPAIAGMASLRPQEDDRDGGESLMASG